MMTKYIMGLIMTISVIISGTSCISTAKGGSTYKPSKPRTLVEKDGKFLLDGKPYQFICGEIHYPRIPRALWRDRLQKMRAGGINCISAYIFWSFHERQPGKFDFSGNADVAEFIKIAHEEGLLVYLRPGPYVCAEYDFGGYPYWLLNEKGMKWRSNDPKFLKYMKRYLDKLGEELADLQISKGGPICFVQVENEYGSYAGDKVYLANIRKMVQDAGFNVMLTTCDGGNQMRNGHVDGCLPTINGSTGNDIFSHIDKYHKGGPYFVSEFYPAWFDVWGKRHSHKDKDHAARQFDWMLSKDVSVSIYMYHGGTNFWYTNGANNPPYAPQPTSYDYDAPLGEYGNMTPKFFALRKVAEKYQSQGEKIPPAPPQPKIVTISEFSLNKSAEFAVALPKAIKSKRPMTMEALKQDLGYVLYRTTINKPIKGTLVCKELRDFGWIMLNGKPIGQMDRRFEQNSIEIDIKNTPAVLEILVENVGRINYGRHLLFNNKGITESVSIAGQEILNWENFTLPLYKEDVFSFKYGKSIKGRPAFHYGTFNLKETGEIFIDTRKWGKGSVWVNGHSLGKFWSIGPQQTMYLPSCWAKKGKNEIVILELDDRGVRTTSGLIKPILDLLQNDPNRPKAKIREGRYPKLEKDDMVVESRLKSGEMLQTVKFDKPVTGRHICLETLSSHNNTSFVHASEIDILDGNGKPYPKNKWKIWFTDSEEIIAENGKAENIIDGKLNTFWHSAWSGSAASKHPHVIVIDTGIIDTISGFSYRGRSGHKHGGIDRFRVYVRPQFFLNK